MNEDRATRPRCGAPAQATHVSVFLLYRTRMWKAALALAILAAWPLHDSVAAARRIFAASGPVAITVAASGQLPGFTDSDITGYLVQEMNQASLGGWTFEAAPGSDASAANRVVWTLELGPSAAGSVRSYAFSRALMERMAASHRHVTIKAKLYLGGQYQTESFGQATIAGGPHDEDLAAEVIKVTRMLMSYPSSVPDRAGDPATAERSSPRS
ncbi:MAG TPA: hypothetical protein VKS60_17715 [Stellaceae bacterium]|nr:hypothetical protein [Stellaceae bacterium]